MRPAARPPPHLGRHRLEDRAVLLVLRLDLAVALPEVVRRGDLHQALQRGPDARLRRLHTVQRRLIREEDVVPDVGQLPQQIGLDRAAALDQRVGRGEPVHRRSGLPQRRVALDPDRDEQQEDDDGRHEDLAIDVQATQQADTHRGSSHGCTDGTKGRRTAFRLAVHDW